MSNTKTEIDLVNILKQHCTIFNEGADTEWIDAPPRRVIDAMKAAIQAAKPIILAHAAEKADVISFNGLRGIGFEVDPSSITNLVDDEELNEKLGI